VIFVAQPEFTPRNQTRNDADWRGGECMRGAPGKALYYGPESLVCVRWHGVIEGTMR
jgi:hypothetical protein